MAFDGNFDLVKLDATTLEEVGRVTLKAAVVGAGLVRDLSITSDGTRGAIPLEWLGEVKYLDLETMSVLQTITTSESRPRIAAITPDGSEIFVFYNQFADAEIYDTQGFGATALPIAGGATSPRYGNAIFGPDGRLYVSRRPGDGSAALLILDPATPDMNQVGLYNGNQLTAITFDATGALLFGKTLGDRLTVLDVATETQLITRLAGAQVRGHHLSITR
jgi:hypothetical protein